MVDHAGHDSHGSQAPHGGGNDAHGGHADHAAIFRRKFWLSLALTEYIVDAHVVAVTAEAGGGCS
jgi:P-type Cu2+ transporter